MQEVPLSSSSSSPPSSSYSPPFIHDEQVLNYILRICQEEWEQYVIDSEASPSTTMPEESVTALAMRVSQDHEEVLSNIFRISQEEWQQYVIYSETSPTTAVPEESVTGSGMGTEERVISPDGLNRRIQDKKVPSEWQKFGDNFEKGKSSSTMVMPEKSVIGSTKVTEERVMSQDGLNSGIHDEKVPRKWQNFEKGGSSLTGAAPDESVTVSGIDVMICDPECFLISELGKPLVDGENESLMNRVDVGICVTCFCNEYMVHQYGRESEYREVWLRRNESILDRLLYLKSSVICLQDFGVANEDFVQVYEMQLKEAGYQTYKVGRGDGTGTGLLTAVRRDHFYVLNHKELLFNDFGDHMVKLLHVELLVPSSRTRKEALVVNTNLIFPHDSTYCFRRLQQVYKILQHIKSYCDQQCLPPVPIILCGVWNGSKKGHVYKFLHSQGFVTSYDAAHHCADNDEDSHKRISHCNHRGTSCAVDFIWLLNPTKHQKPLKESFTEAAGNMLDEENKESRVQTNSPCTSDESLRVRVPDTDSRDLEIGCSIPYFTSRSSQSTRKVWISRCYKGLILVSILGNLYTSVATQLRLGEKASWVPYLSFGMAILQLLAHASCSFIDYFVTKKRKRNLKRDVFCMFIFSILVGLFAFGCTKFPKINDIGVYGMASSLMICFHLLLNLYGDRY